MNANDMTFGVELEVYLPAGTIANIGGYHRGVQIPGLPAGWNAQRDCSLSNPPDGYVGVEVVSPVLRGVDGLRQIKAVCEWLNANHARVNKTCGFHVHVGVHRDEALLRKIGCLAAKHEKALFAMTGTREREGSRFCRTVQGDAGFQAELQARGALARYGAVGRDRYHVLNLTNILGGGRPTVEFRVFAGTTSAIKAILHVRSALAIVEKAAEMTRLPKWTANKAKETSNLHHKGGEGQSEVLRFFYYSGWTAGKAARCYGCLTADDLPGMDEVKREAMRLAAKYDARA